MAGAEAKVTMSAESQQLMQTLASVQKGFDKLSDTLAKQEEQSKKTNREAVDGLQAQESTLNKTVVAAGKLAAGYISIGAALKMASAEYEAWTRKLDASANLATKFSADMTAAAKNSPMPQTDLEKVVMSASAKTGVRPTFLSGGLGGILAAGGASLTPGRLESILTASAPIAGGNAADFEANASALALYRANAGAAGENLTDRQILGYFSSAAGGGLVDKQSQYNPLAARVMAAASANNIDEGEALALFNSIQKATSDKTGDTSVTATIKAISGMAAVRESAGMPGERSVAKLSTMIRGNGGAFGKFMDTATFMTENKAAVGSLFAPGGNGGLLDQALANTPSLATGEAAYNELLGSLRSSSLNRSVAEGESLAAAGERMQLDEGRVRRGILRDKFKMLREGGGGTALGDWMDEKKFDALLATGGDPLDTAIGETETRLRRVRGQQTARAMHYDTMKMFGLGAFAGERNATAEETRDTQVLTEVLRVLIEMRDMSKQPPPVATNGDRPLVPMQPTPMVPGVKR